MKLGGILEQGYAHEDWIELGRVRNSECYKNVYEEGTPSDYKGSG